MFTEDDATKHAPACRSDLGRKAWLRAAESYLASDRMRHGFIDVEQQKKAAIAHANTEYEKLMYPKVG